MMKDVERWLKGNFDRESQSMPGSSVSVTYTPKSAPTDDDTDALDADNNGWLRMPISIFLALGGSLASVTWLIA